MNWLDSIPDLSIKKLALLLSLVDFKNLRAGQLQIVLNQDLINNQLKDWIVNYKYIEEIDIQITDHLAELNIAFNLKGIPFTTSYRLSVESFVFTPTKRQVVLKVIRVGRHNRVIEGIYDLTAKPFLINILQSHGFQFSEPYLYLDFDNHEKFRQFQATLLGSVICAGTIIDLQEFNPTGLVFNIDISGLKEILDLVKTALEQALSEKKTSDEESA